MIRSFLSKILLIPKSNLGNKVKHYYDLDYDNIHNVNIESSKKLHTTWSKVLKKHGIHTLGHCLEIGAGTGYLSYGLVHYSKYHSLIISDNSEKFLKQLKSKLEISNHKNVCVQNIDLNHINLPSGSLNTILGNSILHHVLHYKNALKQLYTSLIKGGNLILLEPILSGRVITAFFLSAIINYSENNSTPFTKEELSKIEKNYLHQTTVPLLVNDIERLAKMEDKYIFDLELIKEVAYDIGYSNVSFENLHQNIDYSYKTYVVNNLRLIGVDYTKLDSFDWLFKSFKNSYGKINSNYVRTPMSFIVLTK